MKIKNKFYVYVDASIYKNDFGVGAFGIKENHQDGKYVCSESKVFEDNKIDSNSMELGAICFSLEYVYDKISQGYINTNLEFVIFCDNESVVKIINTGGLLRSNLDKKISENTTDLILKLKNDYGCIIKFKVIDRAKNTYIHNFSRAAISMHLRKREKGNNINKNNLSQNNIDDAEKEFCDVLNDKMYKRILRKTLNAIAKKQEDIFRVEYVIKKLNSKEVFCVNFEKRKIIFINTELEMYFINDYTGKVNKNFINYINEIFEIIDEYNKQLKQLKEDIKKASGQDYIYPSNNVRGYDVEIIKDDEEENPT